MERHFRAIEVDGKIIEEEIKPEQTEFTDEDFKELDEHYYKSFNPLVCPKCNSVDNVIPLAFGRPSPKLMAYSKAGKVRLMGCCVLLNENSEMVRAYCKSCDYEIYGPMD